MLCEALMVWLGIGESSKVVLIFYTAVFIVTVNTSAGVMSVSESKLRAASTCSAADASPRPACSRSTFRRRRGRRRCSRCS